MGATSTPKSAAPIDRIPQFSTVACIWTGSEGGVSLAAVGSGGGHLTDLVQYLEVQRLLDDIDDVADELAANERDMVDWLRRHCEDPSHNEAQAVRLLETILRNVRIRRAYDVDASEQTRRRIDLGHKLH